MLLMNVHNTHLFCNTVNRCKGPVEMVMANGQREDIRANTALQYLLTDVYPQDRPVSITLDPKQAEDVGKLINFMMCDK